jgi:hypothetical protein
LPGETEKNYETLREFGVYAEIPNQNLLNASVEFYR